MSTIWKMLSLPWQACLEEAWTAYCTGNIPIGSVITDAAGTILCRGRNRRHEAHIDDGYIHGSILAHAELNALIALAKEDVDPHTCILYTVTEPCPLCMGAFYMSGLRELHYASRDPYAGSANLLKTTPYLSRKPIRTISPQDADLELAIMILFVDYAMDDHLDRTRTVFDQWRAVVPASIDLGERVYHSGELRRLRDAQASIEQAFNRLGVIISGYSNSGG